MSSFSMKPQTASVDSSGGASEEEWTKWNEYYYSLFGAKERPFTTNDGSIVDNKFVKKINKTGILNVIIDCGLQPQKDAEYDSKCTLPSDGEEYSSEELAHLEKYKDNKFYWDTKGKRKQSKPEQPKQEYAFYYDFPEIMVDWGNHPIEELRHIGLAPLRVSYNGFFKLRDTDGNFGKRIVFNPHYKTKTISSKSPLYKIAESSGVLDKFINAGYDLGELAGSVCKWDLSCDRYTKDGKTYYNTSVKNPTELVEVTAGGVTITVEQQIPKCDNTFMGATLNGMEYSKEVLEFISHKKELKAVLPRCVAFKPSPVNYPDFVLGCDWEDSDLYKAMLIFSSDNKKEDKKETTKKAPAQNKVVEKEVNNEPNIVEHDIDFDDNIPF